MGVLADAFLYLAAAVVAVPLASRLGLGSVLGYLLAGIALGPVLGLVGAEAREVQHFAELGVVMMLFLVGLELQPTMLWSMRRRLLGLGGLQVLVTAALLGAGAAALGLAWRSALATGMILALSSTAIVLQTLGEKGWMRSPGGQSMFAVLLFQDIAVIPMLALLPLLALAPAPGAAEVHPTGALAHLPAPLRAVAILGVVAAIVVAGRTVMRPVFRAIAGARLREIFTAAALLLVVGIALLMTAVGLSPALGTFLAGVVLSDSEYRHELESDLDPFKGLLLGLFFITVGAGIDFALLWQQPATILGVALGLMATKATVLAGLGTAFGLRGAPRALFALGLAQAGEFAFVLFAFAAAAGVVAPALAASVTLVVAVSMLLTPLLFIVYERAVAPRVGGVAARAADVIDAPGTVIVAGIGRFGQIVSRLLLSNGHRVVVLDHNPELIELMRRVGNPSYYGDARRPDLLHAAGAADARLFVAAVDDRETQNRLVSWFSKHHPECRIIARAHDRHHVYELEDAGAHYVERELFEGSLRAGRQALVELGTHPFRAERQARAFRRHDRRSIAALKARWDEAGMDQAYIDTARAQTRELFELMRDERASRHDASERGWTPPPRGQTRSDSGT